MKVIVQFSGGKDSQAALIWAVNKYGNNNVLAAFCDTVWEHDLTYTHLEYVCKKLDVELIYLKSKKYNGMIDLAKKKGRFPSIKARFCTEELKTKPFIDYVLDECEHILVIQGIRGQESYNRSKMNAQCTLFKYYFEPYRTNSMIIESLERLDKLSYAQKKKLEKAKTRLSEGKEDSKYHIYRKKDVIEHSKKYVSDIIRPHFDESSQFVIDYILENGQFPNPLYYSANKRVGCYPCILSSHNEILNIIEREPKRLDEINNYEIEIGSSFFKTDAIPEKFRTGYNKKTGKYFTTAFNLKKYLLSKNATLDMFEDKSISCSSYYHLCE